MNCVRLLCKHGAHTNCSSRSNLTPLHVLVFTASENIALNREEEKAQVKKTNKQNHHATARFWFRLID